MLMLSANLRVPTCELPRDENRRNHRDPNDIALPGPSYRRRRENLDVANPTDAEPRVVCESSEACNVEASASIISLEARQLERA